MRNRDKRHLVLALSVLRLDVVEITLIKGMSVTLPQFVMFAMVLSAGLLNRTSTFLRDAYRGAQHLYTRRAVAIVGNFPWVLSRFAGYTRAAKAESFLYRTLLVLHPAVYLLPAFKSGFWQQPWCPGLMLILFSFSVWIFILSRRFQKPLFFDWASEGERENEIRQVVRAIEAQTVKVSEFVEKVAQNRDEPAVKSGGVASGKNIFPLKNRFSA